MAALPTATPPLASEKDASEPRGGTSLDTVVEDGGGANGKKAGGNDADNDDEDDEAAAEGDKLKEHWWQVWRYDYPTPPSPATFEETGELPLASCNLWSYLTYSWVHPMMALGYRRPLQPTDLWHIDPSREASLLSSNLDAAFLRRQINANEYNARLLAGEVKPPLKLRMRWALLVKGERRADEEREWRRGWGRKRPNLGFAIVEQFNVFYLSAIIFKIFGDACQLCSPLLAKAIIRFSQEGYAADAAGRLRPGKGRGVGLAIGMYLLTALWSVLQHQVWWRGMTTGVLMRAALTCSVFKRSLVLSNVARATFSNGKLMNHLSTDISRIDYCAMWFPSIPSSPVQIALCTILLCLQIGPSALAGIAFFLLIIPVQAWSMQKSIKIRAESMQYTDQRAKILQELLGAMRVIKYFVFEKPYAEKIDELRRKELAGIRTLLMVRALNTAVAFSLPVLSAVISLCCYVGTGNSLDPALIFTALSLFQLLRQPLMLLPTALSALTDAYNATKRLTDLFEAETHDTALSIDPSQASAILVSSASFEWVGPPSEDSPSFKKASSAESKAKSAAAFAEKEKEADAAAEPFKIENLQMEIKKGSLVAVVGTVGSGKSSLLQGLIGEMKLVEGKVSFSGRVAYCGQTPWIQNATLKENVIFGREYDEKKYWEVVRLACLLPDYEMLPDGDLTEIGEKGINLSGGQKQRVNIARALYFDADCILFDDPLSALDAHVGKSIFQNAIVDNLRARGKTVVLVTHALHFLPQVDEVFTIENGSIVESGSYATLIHNKGPFSRLMVEFGGQEEEKEAEEEAEEEDAIEGDAQGENKAAILEDLKKPEMRKRMSSMKKEVKEDLAKGTGKKEGRLIVNEARETGSIKGDIYKSYANAGHGLLLIPTIAAFCIAAQGAQVVGSYWVVWWQEDQWRNSTGFYMGIYALLGCLQALMTLSLGFAMAFFSYFASRNLHKQAVHRIFFAPMSFFDTTPLGRIISVFGKDCDVVDNTLPESLRNVVMTISNVIGSIILITVFEHYFIIVAVFVCIGYRYFQRYYQASGRELKRIDSMLRSLLYSHFSESLSGLATIRAYGESARFVKENQRRMDLEDRAYVVYVATQRWLAVRLDAVGALLILAVALLVAIGPSGISPSQVGLLLTYTVSLVQMFGMLTRQTAEVENNLNGVERIAKYTSSDLSQEAPYEIPSTAPLQDWPQQGSIVMDSVVMSYREGLPPVLKGISLSVKGGEKVGVIGRTGAGKSSIMSALFRLVELTSGSISIDGLDISTLGLRDLRRNVIIIPQDAGLFSGTIRTNLDPFGTYDDAKLWSALQRAHLVGPDSIAADPSSDEKFSLDMVVEEEGQNLSVGQRSLVSLARALVRSEARIVILDEATAAVDLETDSKIQATIRRELKDKTLLTIAHRLRTIIFYDRILVMDNGKVAEFGTPLDLFNDTSSIFHSMCLKSNISYEEIVRAGKEDDDL